jgi:hypothetical protein
MAMEAPALKAAVVELPRLSWTCRIPAARMILLFLKSHGAIFAHKRMRGQAMDRTLGIVLAFTSSVACAQSPPPSAQVKEELKKYYEQKGYPASWTTAESDLASADEKKRQAASEKLIAVLAQAKADESDGSSPWRATPFWGNPRDNPARNFRRYLLQDLMKEPAKPGAVPILRWFIFQEALFAFQTGAAKALQPIASDEANALRLEIIKARPENAWLLAAALQQARERKLAVSDEVLTEFAAHHRPSLRSAAAAWLKAEKKTVPEFDAAKALQREPLKKIVEQLAGLWPDIPAAEVAPLIYRERYLRDDGVTVDLTPQFVWPVSESKKSLQVIDLHGRSQSYDQATRNGNPKKPRESTWRTELADIEKEVKAIARVRAKGNPDFALSSEGGLTGQFEGNGPTLKEMLLGAWLYRAKRFDIAAALLLPAFDATDSDANVVEIARQQLAIVYGQAMLGAFTYREFPEALRLALLTEKLYPETTYSMHAKRLARELPLRKDDFQKFSLPTAKEWSTLKPMLSREKQIHYLCERLRMLNCFQYSQPGGVSYSDPQFKEPGGYWGDDDKPTEVINPLCELEGYPGDERRKRPKLEGLKLTLGDVPALATHLKDDWTMVMVSYWRSFHPSRELHFTRVVIADLIRSLAKQDICRVADMAKMSAQEIETHIAAIQAWAREHAGKSEADLHVEALEKAVREDTHWSWNAAGNASALVDMRDRRVIACALKFLDRKEASDYDFASILRSVAPLEPATFKPYALKMLEFKDRSDQLWAACLLVSVDEAMFAFDRFETIISAKEPFGEAWNWRYALKVLEAAKSDRAKTLTRKIISGHRLLERQGEYSSWELRHEFVPKFYSGGYRDEILRFYDALLDDMTPRPWNVVGEDTRNQDVYAGELIELLGGLDKALKALGDKPGNSREKIPELKKWIAGKLAETKK